MNGTTLYTEALFHAGEANRLLATISRDQMRRAALPAVEIIAAQAHATLSLAYAALSKED